MDENQAVEILFGLTILGIAIVGALLLTLVAFSGRPGHGARMFETPATRKLRRWLVWPSVVDLAHNLPSEPAVPFACSVWPPSPSHGRR